MRQSASFFYNLHKEWTKPPTTPAHYVMIVIAIVATMALYYVGSKLGFLLAVKAEQVTVVWPPTGIALAAVLLLGRRIWPGIWLGAFFANFTSHEPLLTACGIATGNALEAIAAAWMLHRFVHFRNNLSRIKDILGLVVFSAILSTVISATLGVASLCLGGLQPWGDFNPLWQRWWLGDATGALLFAPPFLVWSDHMRSYKPRRGIIEFMLLLAGVALTSVVIFTGSISLGIITAPAFIYLIFPFIIWAAIRFSQQGVTVITLLASVIASWATLHRVGPFAVVPSEQSYALLQIFLSVMSVTGLILSAAALERREAERGRAQLAAIVASSHDAIIGEDLSGIITYWNEGAEWLFGYGAAEAIGRPNTLIALPQQGDEDFRIIEDVLSGKRAESYETVRRTKDGQNLNISLTASPVHDEDGKIIGISKVARDATERMQSEHALKEADRRKDEFLAVLAHELRNPLAPLSHALHVLKSSSIDMTKREKAHEIMQHQLQQVVRLVDDLIDVSRISHGKVELQRKRTTLKDAIDAALETVRPLIEAKSHALSVHMPEDTVWLDADLTRLSQVFANLLNNAVKYTAAAGQIWVDATVHDKMVMVRVRDTGVGIPQHMLSHIFDMFTQVNHAVEKTHQGLGIGLTLVKNFVELHGGRIEARSRGVGCGSEFVVSLPIIQPPQEIQKILSAKGKEEIKPVARKLRVLVVDDHKTLAETLGWMVEITGHDVQLAYDGLGALTTARSFHPDVVLLDIGLSGMNGYEVCQRMRADPVLKNCVIVAQTGWSQMEHRERSKAAGFNLHLVKPVHIETLEELFASLPDRASTA